MGAKSKPPLLEKGAILNEKWEILEHIATGGMAEVYRARQIKLDREVAVKVLSQEFLDAFEGDEAEVQIALERFDREVKAMAQVRHPNVLQVYDLDRAVFKRNGGEVSIQYIAMEYVPGPNLRSTLPPEGMGANEEEIRKWIRNYFLPILDGVETVHARGIVHRDLKPENVLLDGFIPRITDFGLAGGTRWKPVTQSHHIAGTAPYQALEQFVDMGETDVRADIYSLGKILYETVSGKMDKKPALFWKTARLSNPDTFFLRRLDRVIQQATAEDKNQRIPSVKVLRQAVVDLLEERRESKAGFGWSYLKRFGIRKLIFVMAILIIVAGVSIGFHVLLYPREKYVSPAPSIEPLLPGITQGQVTDLPESTPARVPLSSPTSTFIGKDGATLRLVPEGEVILPENFGPQAGKSVRIDSFFLDEAEVTNHQYVVFLNQVLPKIRIEGGVVRGNNDVWLLLGEATKGYEPIVFRDGRFFVKDLALHSHPVVRVTPHGAVAYARFYGRRLPTEVEWLRAMTGRDKASEKPSELSPESSGMMGDMATMHRQMDLSSSDPQAPSKLPVPVVQFKPNAYGIRGLAGNVNEWGLSLQTGSSQEKDMPQYVVLPSSTPRYPWEAFEEVGLRTALSVPSQGR